MVSTLIVSIIRAVQMLLFVRVISSWFPDVARSSFGEFLHNATEPMLAPVRNFLRQFSFFNNLPIDFSFIILYFGLDLIRTFVYVIL